MTTAELADFLGIQRSTAYRLIQWGRVPAAFRVARAWRIDVERLKDWPAEKVNNSPDSTPPVRDINAHGSFWGTHIRPVLAVTITLVAALIGLSWPDQIFAQATQTTTLGSLGIVAGQTVRVSAFREPYEDLEVTLCSVDLSFFDISGKRQSTVTENLDPGERAFLDLPWADITPPPTSGRAEVNTVVDGRWRRQPATRHMVATP